MKTCLLLLLLLAVTVSAQTAVAPIAPAAVPAVPVLSPTDAEWAHIQDLLAPLPDPRPKPFTEAIYLKWNEERLRNLQTAGLAFYEQHAGDPRRWQAAALVLQHQPAFWEAYKPEFDKEPTPANANLDEVARTRWQERRAILIREILVAESAGSEAHEMAEVAAFKAEMTAWSALDAARIEDAILRLARTYPEGEQVYYLMTSLQRKLERENAPAAAALWVKLLDTPHARIRITAEGIRRLVEGKSKPVELKFTALDGREVDLVQLRGKVVLIDFWAMWCGPCLAELPNVKKVYTAYHDQGFEVVGISLDGPNDRAKLEAFLKKQDMTWPQRFDGLSWQTELAVKYAVNAIPAMLLLDKSGLVVSTKARGEALESTVRHYLGL